MLAKGSVSNQKDIDRIFKKIKDTMPPLRGIQHAAMVLDDGSIPEIDHERYMKVYIPKAVGCWILHEKTKKMKLDHFINYSSISAIYGNPGQVSGLLGQLVRQRAIPCCGCAVAGRAIVGKQFGALRGIRHFGRRAGRDQTDGA